MPTGATGASPVKREYPQIVSFSWPDKSADDELKGTFLDPGILFTSDSLRIYLPFASLKNVTIVLARDMKRRDAKGNGKVAAVSVMSF